MWGWFACASPEGPLVHLQSEEASSAVVVDDTLVAVTSGHVAVGAVDKDGDAIALAALRVTDAHGGVASGVNSAGIWQVDTDGEARQGELDRAVAAFFTDLGRVAVVRGVLGCVVAYEAGDVAVSDTVCDATRWAVAHPIGAIVVPDLGGALWVDPAGQRSLGIPAVDAAWTADGLRLVTPDGIVVDEHGAAMFSAPAFTAQAVDDADGVLVVGGHDAAGVAHVHLSSPGGDYVVEQPFIRLRASERYLLVWTGPASLEVFEVRP